MLHGFLDAFFGVSREPSTGDVSTTGNSAAAAAAAAAKAAAASEERKSTKDAQTPNEREKKRRKDDGAERRCDEPKEAQVLECLFEFLAKWPSVRSAGHSSQPESNEITRIYIL